MRKVLVCSLVIALVVGIGFVWAAKGGKKGDCTTIQDGLFDSEGRPLVLGYDQFGYNYQAHMFNGRYCDVDRVEGGDYCDVDLIMKWNDAWLSNMSCDDDGKLDRPDDDGGTYIGSGAWETNHQKGSYDEDGKTQHWEYFVKIIAAPEDATRRLDEGDPDDPNDNIWYWDAADGTEIGPVIWGSFAIIQSVYNDTGTGEHGIEYLSPSGPGLGKF